MKKIPLIHDGDHGSDDFVTTLMLLGRSDLFDVLAVTTCHGNVPVETATMNALRALELCGRPEIGVYQGCAAPFRIPPKAGDNAFESDGLSGAPVPMTDLRPQPLHAVDYLRETLLSAPEPVTLVVTGPMTNIAVLLSRHPEVKAGISRIVAMGGGFDPDGNITPHAEFNFFMDPDAADFVLNSGVAVVLHTLHSDHQLVFTPERQAQMRRMLPPLWNEVCCTMMRGAEKYDIPKFGASGAFVHDQHTAVYLQNPELYDLFYAIGSVDIDTNAETHGRFRFTEVKAGTLQIARNLVDPQRIFDVILKNIGMVALPEAKAQPHGA